MFFFCNISAIERISANEHFQQKICSIGQWQQNAQWYKTPNVTERPITKRPMLKKSTFYVKKESNARFFFEKIHNFSVEVPQSQFSEVSRYG